MKMIYNDELLDGEPITMEDVLKSIISSAPSITTVLNLYSAYKYFGPQAAALFTATSLGDGYLQQQFGTKQHHLSLSAFWGSIAFRAVSQVQNSNISPEYKTPLSILFALTAAGMVAKGHDVFEKKHDIAKTLKALKLTAGFFDEDGAIGNIEKAFDEGYLSGIKSSIKHAKDILSNKFVLYALGRQGIDAVKLVLDQAFSSIPSSKLAIFLATQEGKGFKYVIEKSLYAFAKKSLDLAHSKATGKLSDTIEHDISVKVANITLGSNDSSKIMSLGNNINSFSLDVTYTKGVASNNISSLIEGVLRPLIVSRSNNFNDGASSFYSDVVNRYPSLILLNGLVDNILDYQTLVKIKNYVETIIYGKTDKNENNKAAEMTESRSQQFGACTINTTITPTNYTFTNIQEIIKLGGNKFMLDKLLKFLEYSNNNTQSTDDSFIFSALDLLKSLMGDLIFAAQILSLNISPEEISTLDYKLNLVQKNLGISNEGTVSFGGNQEDAVERAIETLKVLKNESTNGPSRTLSKDMSLTVKGYRLKKTSEKFDMINIDSYTFEPSKIYAIAGQIGTGKTTFLTDIAKCMLNLFESKGAISYQVYTDKQGQTHAAELIFCGTKSFAPPATTLFERVTYRIPEDYRNNNYDRLLKDAIALFKSFDQDGFTVEKFSIAKNDTALGLSTGQEKLVILVAAILYKQYLNKPVLFVIDESLANLDPETSSKVCTKIKKVFIDSIVLSVDHNYRTNPSFYDKVFDLSLYKVDEHLSKEEDNLLMGSVVDLTEV